MPANVEKTLAWPIQLATRTSVNPREPVRAGGEPLVVEKARNGDRTAFARLYEQYNRMVHAILLSRVPRCEVDDLVQDVFVLALRRLSTLRDSAAFGGWLAMIARNRATDYLRTAPAVSPIQEGQLRMAAASPESMAALDAILALPDCYRETLLMRLVEGMTGPEIAERTGLTQDSVRVNLHRGMKLLRERINGEARP